MKKLLVSVAMAAVAPLAWAQMSSTETTTTTTTDGGGTIYVTKSGKDLDEEVVKTRIKVGVPVHVHYSGEGDNMLVDRVVLDED